MPPHSPSLKPNNLYFFYGHRKPSQNRPTVHGGLFSNRQTLDPLNPSHSLSPRDLKVRKSNAPSSNSAPFKLRSWDSDAINNTHNPNPANSPTPSRNFFHIAQKLSPIGRYICDSFRKNGRWGPPVISDLNKLRRVTPDMVAEVLKVESDPVTASRFFHWAGKQKGFKHTYVSYNAFAYCLNRLNRFRAADQLPELMHMQGRPPSEKQFEILIRTHADNNRGLRVYFIYEKMKKFGVKPRVFLYNRIMDALVKTGHLNLAMSVYDDFKGEGLVEESITYMILAKGLCKEGRMGEMFEVLDRMRSNLCRPDVFAYTAMIRVLVMEENLDGCLKVWDEMRRDDVEPDAMAYKTVITALCNGRRAEEAYALFNEMKKRGLLIDRAIYGSLVEAFVVDGKVGRACDLLKDLMDSGYRADLAIYNSLIEGLCRVKQIEKAYNLFKVTVQESLQPDFKTVKPILVSFADSGKMDEFCSLLVQMQNLGFCIMDDLSKLLFFMVEDNLALSLKLFDDLKARGYCCISIYNILIGVLYKNGEAGKALSLFNEMNGSNLEPDSSTYSHVVSCLVELEDIKEACSYYNKIKEMSLCPSVTAYCSLAKGLCKIGEIDAALLIVRDCLANVSSGPMEFMCSLTILRACKSNDSVKVVEVIDEMVQQGCLPDDIVCCSVISGMCQHGTVEEARKVFQYMEDQKWLTEADVIVYDERLIDHLRRKTANLVMSGLKFFGLERKLQSKGCTLLSG